MVLVLLLGIGMAGAGVIGIGVGRRGAGSLAILGAASPWVLFGFAEISGACSGDTSGFCLAYLAGLPSAVGLAVGGVAAIVCLVPRRKRPHRAGVFRSQPWDVR